MNLESMVDRGIDPFNVIVVLLIMQVIIFVLLIAMNIRYSRMKRSYSSFMRGKSGKNMEESILSKFEEVDKNIKLTYENSKNIKDIRRQMLGHYQKIGIVRYDAFLEMGGNLSFALTLLDQEDNGVILNVMHSREGCYTYIKEIIKGTSYIELAEEESESLERAIFQDEYVKAP